MLYHVGAYSESLGQVTNSDMNAAADDVIQRRNDHFIFSEPFNMLWAWANGTTLTRARFGNVALTIRGTNHIFPIDRTATVVSRPRPMDRRHQPLEFPLNEEITIEATTDAVGPVITSVILGLAKPSWTRNLPAGLDILTTRATVVIAAGAGASWTALAPVVMERDLFNGVYAVVGAEVIAANALAFRMFFPSQPQADGRQLRPGGLVINAIGDFPHEMFNGGLGEWGRFHTFELPSIQTFDDTAGGTYEVRLHLVYLGTSVALLRAGA